MVQKKIIIVVLSVGFLIITGRIIFTNNISIKGMGVNSNNDKSMIFQTKGNNCGPAALKMIFDYYKIPATLAEIENISESNSSGTSMLALKKAAELKGLHAEGWRLSSADFLKIAFPVILFVNDSHFIVADSVLGDTLFFRDPAVGKLTLPIRRLHKKWHGETLIFKRQ